MIRDSMPLPELSAGFKSRVMAECSVSITSADKAWRWKVGATTAAVCGLGLLICIVWPATDRDSQTVIRQLENRTPKTDQQYQLPTSAAGQLTVDTPQPTAKPAPQRKNGSSTDKDLIDGLNQRQQLFDANMLPRF